MAQIRKRQQNRGLRKICGCPRRVWGKCRHPWHFNYKVRGGQSYRFSLDTEVDQPIKSKGEAEAAADHIRTAIRAGTFARRTEASPAAAVTPASALTLEAFGQKYFERVGKPASANTRACFRQLVAFLLNGERLGEKALAAITEDDLDVVFAQLRADGKAASTRNKYVQTVTMMLRWATKKGYLQRNPAADCESLKREQHAQRNRRLEPDEESRLLAVAGPSLQRILIAALETGCRRGELLSLTWRDINFERREMTILAARTKTKAGRVLPISARLVAVLEMARHDPAGALFGPDAAVFGDVVGRPVKDIKRAWETAVMKAHGHAPTWTRGHALSAASREALARIDLTFHDLRHEAGSRLLEQGWPLHNVSHMLGHANIAQTSTYLNASKVGLQDSMRRLDDARSRCNPVANETEIDRAPVRNEPDRDQSQSLVN